jgi:mono/diheme cytochrome c family protein
MAVAVAALLLTGCHMDMWVQPKVRPYQPSDVFADGASMRPLVPHSVDRTHFWSDEGRYTGYAGGKLVTTLPVVITKPDLERGQERFNIYCSPCHGALGTGQGMIAQRGFALRRQPATYHTDRLRKMQIGHFYDVITNGYGVMYPYASRVEPDDRWRIAAYIRVLQRSQHASPADLPADLDPQTREGLLSAGTTMPQPTTTGTPDRVPTNPEPVYGGQTVPQVPPTSAGSAQPTQGKGSQSNER